ncbi:MAG TPA: hypothetical protein VF546_03740 [Pyrinomonadaceae bacterium]|jgi:hypothetical protein
MHDDEKDKDALTFDADQQHMFGESEAYQAGQPVRPRDPTNEARVPADLDVHFEPPETWRADEATTEPLREVVAARGEGGADITGGTDKYGPGGKADSEAPATAGTGARETGDIAGASSTHAGAGGNEGPTGGVGTAPNTVGGGDAE